MVHRLGQLLEQAGITTRRPVAKSPLSSAELQAEVGNADALDVALDDVDAAVIAAAPNLKVIAKHGVGVDNIGCRGGHQAGVVSSMPPAPTVPRWRISSWDCCWQCNGTSSMLTFTVGRALGQVPRP